MDTASVMGKKDIQTLVAPTNAMLVLVMLNADGERLAGSTELRRGYIGPRILPVQTVAGVIGLLGPSSLTRLSL